MSAFFSFCSWIECAWFSLHLQPARQLASQHSKPYLVTANDTLPENMGKNTWCGTKFKRFHGSLQNQPPQCNLYCNLFYRSEKVVTKRGRENSRLPGSFASLATRMQPAMQCKARQRR